MTVNTAEREFIRSLPKPYAGCKLLQAAKDKKLRAELTVALGSTALAETAMRVVRECRA